MGADIAMGSEINDERAAERANAFFDAVLVHSDPAFARLMSSWVTG